MLFGDADVEEAVGEALLEREQTCGPRHGRGEGDHLGVPLGQLQQRLGESLGESRPGERSGGSRARHLEVVQALHLVVLGRPVAPSLLREHLDHYGPVVLGRVPQRLFHARDVVAVERTHVTHAQGGEEVPGLEHLPERGADALEPGLGQASHRGQLAKKLLQPGARRDIGGVQPQTGETLREA